MCLRLHSLIAASLMLCLSSLFSAPALAAGLTLNGSAVYSHLSRDYYVGGLYLAALSDDPAYVYSASVAKEMRLVVLAPRWSPRRWTQFWQNDIAINNSLTSADAQLQKALMQFTSFPRNDLEQGDVLSFSYQPGGNTRILLNNELVLESPGTELFNLLVNTWIGKVPPSRPFRAQILAQGNTDAEHVSRLQSNPARPRLWSGWVAAERAAEKRRQDAEEALRRAERERQAERSRLAQAEQQRAQEERQQAEEAARSEARRQREEEQQARSAAERLARERAAQQQRAQEQSVKAQAARLNQAGNRKNATTLAEEQRYHLQMLQWHLQRQLEAEVSYPAWAQQFRHEGLVELDLRLNRNQEVSDMQARDDGVSGLLTSEVQRAAVAAAAKIAIASDLAGDSWPLTVRYQFSLQNSAQPALKMPVAPASLQATPTTAKDRQQLENQYRQQQLERIQAAVSYPPAARILKKQDKVQFEVVIKADGSVAAVRESRASRHRELNQAMHSAISNSQPFPPLPAGLNRQQLTLTVEHDFRL